MTLASIDFSALMSTLLAPDKMWSLCTVPFMVLFCAFFLIYLRVVRSRRMWMMLYVIGFSLLFAWKANGVLMLLLPATALLSWLMTEQIKVQTSARKRKLWLAATIVLMLVPLVYFKYANFLGEVWSEIVRSNFSPMHIFLPVGISFYTFQAISYSIDVYRGTYTERTGLMEYFFYLTFFPLLMAGPITRAGVLIPQLHEESYRKPADALAYQGLWLIVCGLLKKALISDYIADYNNWIFSDPMGYSGFENLMGVLGYTLQIYCDFSGYSDMSIGLAAIMGFKLKENFNFPYKSHNLQDFWRRWHIALSTWFRDYLYIPLGGNRKGRVRTYLNNMVTMLVAGLWHGASWMFVMWGALHGAGLVLHKFCRNHGLDKIPNSVPVVVVSWLVTFAYVALAWIFFRATSLDNAFAVIGRIFSDFSLDYLVPFVKARPMWTIFVLLGFGFQLISEKAYGKLQSLFVNTSWLAKLIIFITVLQLIITFRQATVQPFIYAGF